MRESYSQSIRRRPYMYSFARRSYTRAHKVINHRVGRITRELTCARVCVCVHRQLDFSPLGGEGGRRRDGHLAARLRQRIVRFRSVIGSPPLTYIHKCLLRFDRAGLADSRTIYIPLSLLAVRDYSASFTLDRSSVRER